MKIPATNVFTRFLAGLAIAFTFMVSAATAATNYSMPGEFVQPGGSAKQLSNDKPFYRWFTPKTFGTTDTLFGVLDAGGLNKFNTSGFNSARNAIQNSNNGITSAVVGQNPDSVVCKAILIGVGADSAYVSFGVLDSLGLAATSTRPNTVAIWNQYGSSTTLNGLLASSGYTTIRTSIPFVANTYFKWYMTTRDATDTATVAYADCKDISNH